MCKTWKTWQFRVGFVQQYGIVPNTWLFFALDLLLREKGQVLVNIQNGKPETHEHVAHKKARSFPERFFPISASQSHEHYNAGHCSSYLLAYGQ